jgi:hypothetical protein
VYIFILHLYEGGMKHTCSGSEICTKLVSVNLRFRDLSEQLDVDDRLMLQRSEEFGLDLSGLG